jgi:iron(III) transport system ATP-binding protein
VLEFLKAGRRARESKHAPSERGRAGVTFAARLTFEDVSKRYGESLALDQVCLDVPPGEVLCLLGPSGCGKTTLLRIAAGVERPTTGRVLLVPPEKRGVGLMFQDFALFPHLTIQQNVAFGLRSLTRSEANSEALAALTRVGLADYANEYPHILSGGEQQRVALARAIAPRPSVLLKDEPFSGLDPRLRERMREETLAILHETRATSIVVTHDSEEAMRMGDGVVLLRKGRVVQSGRPLDLYRAPKDILAARTFSDLTEVPARIEKGNCQDGSRQFPRQRPRRRQGGNRLRAPAGRAPACRRRRHPGARARPPLPRRRCPGGDGSAGARCPTVRLRAGKRRTVAWQRRRHQHRCWGGAGVRR